MSGACDEMGRVEDEVLRTVIRWIEKNTQCGAPKMKGDVDDTIGGTNSMHVEQECIHLTRRKYIVCETQIQTR